MPPHCDTKDGPVVKAAQRALETGNVNLILPWVPGGAEGELRDAFRRTLEVRNLGGRAQDLSDDWFFETAVRLHRMGEGAPYTGLKPAGLDEGPVVPRAERAIERKDARELIEFLTHDIAEVLQEKFRRAIARQGYSEHDVPAAREYVEAMLDFTLFSHHLYTFVHTGGGHEAVAEGPQHEVHAHRAA